jgi:hypothetical protein
MRSEEKVMRIHRLSVGLVPAIALWSSVGIPVQARQGEASTLIDVVRAAVQPFGNPEDATGYGPFLGCVSGPQGGAMGVHYVNGSLLDTDIDPMRPEALIYEPGNNGRYQLVGVEFIVPAAPWDAAHPGAPPVLMGQLYNFVGSPNRYGIPAFYELHVWTGKANPDGAFADWHPHVSCDKYAPQD